MAMLGGIGPEDPANILYNRDKTFAVREKCDGKLVSWIPRFERDYVGDGHWDGPYDHAIIGFHYHSYRDGTGWKCSRCGLWWEDCIRDALTRTYPNDEILFQ